MTSSARRRLALSAPSSSRPRSRPRAQTQALNARAQARGEQGQASEALTEFESFGSSRWKAIGLTFTTFAGGRPLGPAACGLVAAIGVVIFNSNRAQAGKGKRDLCRDHHNLTRATALQC